MPDRADLRREAVPCLCFVPRVSQPRSFDVTCICVPRAWHVTLYTPLGMQMQEGWRAASRRSRVRGLLWWAWPLLFPGLVCPQRSTAHEGTMADPAGERVLRNSKLMASLEPAARIPPCEGWKDGKERSRPGRVFAMALGRENVNLLVPSRPILGSPPPARARLLAHGSQVPTILFR